MQGGVSRERVECAAPPPTCPPPLLHRYTRNMLDWETVKLPLSASVMCLGQRGKVTKDTDVGFLNGLAFFFFFSDRNFMEGKIWKRSSNLCHKPTGE